MLASAYQQIHLALLTFKTGYFAFTGQLTVQPDLIAI
jgi:hypothetical protein